MKKVLCIGSATKDVFLPLDDIKIIENTGSVTEKKLMAFEYGAKLYAKDIYEMVGGSAVNIAAGLARCEYKPFVMARTSKSDIGKWILKKIGALQVKKNYMQQTSGMESEVSIIMLDTKTIEHAILRTGDSVESFDISKGLDKFREKVEWIFIGSLKKGWQEKMDKITDFAKKKKARIAFNPSGYQISHDAAVLSNYLSQVEILFVNRDEALEIIQNVRGQVQDEPSWLCQRLLDYGCRVVALTDGENGAYVADQGGVFYLSTQAVKKVDSLGAGDAFTSGFLASYIADGQVKQALVWGIINSASVVAHIGSTDGLLNKKILEQQGQSLVGQVSPVS